MTEVVSKVHDLVYPSPTSLKEISSVAIALELWRLELKKHRMNGTLDTFLLQLPVISSKNFIPSVPSTINYIIDEYLKRFRFSMYHWLLEHSVEAFSLRSCQLREALSDFDDFVCDWNGDINYVRTAKRLIDFNLLNKDEQFNIACVYCFEDDIQRLWPFVSNKFDLGCIDFDQFPLLYYWICLLKNKLDQVPNPTSVCLELMMMFRCNDNNWSAIEYFWNCLSSEIRLEGAIFASMCHKESFVRFILQKLNNQELDIFVVGRSSDLIVALLTNSQNKYTVLPTWMYIKEKMSEIEFKVMLKALIETETDHHIAEDIANEKSEELRDWFSTADETYLCCEIWKSAPKHLKQLAIKDILMYKFGFEKITVNPAEHGQVKFLLTILSDASFEQRNQFWYKNWQNLINGTRGQDIHQIMRLCFKDENDIKQFKESTMSKYENISSYCVEVLRVGCFAELDNFLIFCCPQMQTRKYLKQCLLQSFLSDDSVLHVSHLSAAKQMSDFIDDAYESAQEAAIFKKALALSRVAKLRMSESIRMGYWSNLTKFVSLFLSHEQDVIKMKKRFVDYLRGCIKEGAISVILYSDVRSFLLWCLLDEKKVVEFKESISPLEVLHRMLKTRMLNYRSSFDDFLSWYFDTPEQVHRFQVKHADVLDKMIT